MYLPPHYLPFSLVSYHVAAIHFVLHAFMHFTQTIHIIIAIFVCNKIDKLHPHLQE